MDWLITLSGDVNSACFNDAGIIGGMTSPTQAKQMTLSPFHAVTAARRAIVDRANATYWPFFWHCSDNR